MAIIRSGIPPSAASLGGAPRTLIGRAGHVDCHVVTSSRDGRKFCRVGNGGCDGYLSAVSRPGPRRDGRSKPRDGPDASARSRICWPMFDHVTRRRRPANRRFRGVNSSRRLWVHPQTFRAPSFFNAEQPLKVDRRLRLDSDSGEKSSSGRTTPSPGT